jgi:hypothetical protein
MYTTIEADMKNGGITDPESRKGSFVRRKE